MAKKFKSITRITQLYYAECNMLLIEQYIESL